MKKALIAFSLFISTAFCSNLFAASPENVTMPTDGTGWYAGAGVNFNNITNSSKSNPGFGIFIGNNFSKHLSLELGLNKIGNQVYTETNNNDPIRIDYKDAYHAYLDAVLTTPVHFIPNLEVFAKGGLSYFGSEKNAYLGDGNNLNSKLSTFAINYGIGAQFNYHNVGVRLSYSQMQPNKKHLDEPIKNHHKDDIFVLPDTMSLEILYRFT